MENLVVFQFMVFFTLYTLSLPLSLVIHEERDKWITTALQLDN